MGLPFGLEEQVEDQPKEHHHEKLSPFPKSWVPWSKGVARKKLCKQADLAKVLEANATTKMMADATPRPTQELEVPVHGGMRIA